MSSEDLLLMGAALIIAINRLYSHTGLRSIRLAYAAVQGINLSACLVLFFWKLEDIEPRLDAAIRLFLLAFVTWHMALNYRSNLRRARERQAAEVPGEAAPQLEEGGSVVSLAAGESPMISDDRQDL